MNNLRIFSLLRLGKELSFQKRLLAANVPSPSVQKIDNPKTGILMLNMGGPQTTDQVHDYLLNIMTDRDMIQLPFQNKLGPYIAKRRTPEVVKKYQEIGGGSPILKWTQLQGELLCNKLDKISPKTGPHKYYVGFRYVNPFTEDTLKEMKEDKIQRAIIFSQYPQYSCATSGSSFNSIFRYFQKEQLSSDIKWSIIDRWGTHPLLIQTIAERIIEELKFFPEDIRKEVMVLFSAHSLPLKTVIRGDSYPYEVGATVQLVMEQLNNSNPYELVWQSKVGPLPWLGPFTDDAIKGYVKQGKKHFLLVPVAFVNEHIETLHELDIEYCHDLTKELGLEPGSIRRASAPNDHPLFIDALTNLVKNQLDNKQQLSPKFLTRCPHCVNSTCEMSKKWYKQLCQ